MSRTIDEKVVSLEFDNEKFEKNVKTSMSTIEKLKAALKFEGATKGMEDVEKASKKMNFDEVSDNVDKVTVKFDVLQTVAVRAIGNITDKVVDMGLKLIQSLSGFDMVRSGYSKMDDLNASVQTLMNSTGKSVEEITGYLDRLMVFSDETSYGFTDMTSALATMVASGGNIERLIPMIEGMANATAYAGKSAAEFKRVIYNLNQSYSGGYLTLMDWKSVANVNVNSKALIETLIRYGEELGKIKKGTVDLGNFTETLKNKWVDTEVMELAFGETFAAMTSAAHEMLERGEVDNFTAAYKILAKEGFDPVSVSAALAAQEAKSFKEAMDATTDAVSSKWSQAFSYIFGDYTEAKKTWSHLAEDLYIIFAQPLDDISNTVIRPAFTSHWTQFRDLLRETGVDVNVFQEQLLKYDEANGGALSRLIEQYGSLKDAMDSGYVPNSFIAKFIDVMAEGEDVISGVTSKLETFQKVFDDIWSGKFGNGEARIKALTDAGYDYATVQELINKLAKEGHRTGYKLIAEDLKDLSDEQLKSLGLTEDQAKAFRKLAEEAHKSDSDISKLISTLNKPSGQQLLSNIITNLTGTIINLQETAREAWDEVMDIDFASVIYNIVKAVSDFTDKIRDFTDNNPFIKTTLKVFYSGLNGVLKVFKLIGTVAGQLTKGVFSVLDKVFQSLNINIPDFTLNLTSGLDKLIDWIDANDVIFKIVETLGGVLLSVIPLVKSWFEEFKELPFVQKGLEAFRDIVEDISNKEFDFSKITKPLLDLKASIANGTFNPLEFLGLNISNIFESLSSSVGKYTTNVKNSFRDMLSPLKLTEEEWSKLGSKLQSAGETIIGLGTGYMMLSSLNKFAEAASNLVSPFKAFSDIVKSAQGTFGAITKYFNTLTQHNQVNNILKLAIAMGILTAALWALAKLGPNELLLATGALIGLSVAIGILSASMGVASAAATQANASGLPKLLLSLAGSLLIMAFAMKTLDGLQNGWNSVFQLVAVLAALAAAVWALNKYATNIMIGSDFATPILAFAAGLFIIASALKKLESVKLSWSAVGTISILMAVLLAMTKITAGLKGFQGLQIIGIAVSLLMFAKIIEKLNKISFEDAYGGLIKMIPAITAIALILRATKGVNATGYTSAAIIISSAAAVYMMGKAIEKLGSLDKTVLFKGGIAAAALFTVIGIVGVGLTKSLSGVDSMMFGLGKAAGMAVLMVAACGSLYLMAGAIMVFKNMDPDGLRQGVETITVLLLALGASMHLIGTAASGIDYNTVGALGKLVVLLGVLAASVFVLSRIEDTNKLGIIIGGLTSIILSLGVLISTISKYNFGLKGALAGVIEITLVLAAIAGAIYFLTTITETRQAIEAATAISELALSLSGALLLMAVASRVAGPQVLTTIPMLLEALKWIGLVIGALGLIAVAAGEQNMASFITGITQVGEAIGGFVGGLVGSLVGSTLESITNVLPTVGQNISDFANNIKPFLNLVIPETFGTTIESLVTLFESFGGLHTQDSLQRIANSTKYMDGVKDFLMNFGVAIINFSSVLTAGGVNTAAINAAAAAGSMFAELVNSLPNDGILASMFTSKESLATFAAEMEIFAQSLVNISATLKYGPFDVGIVKIAATAGSMMSELANSLPANGGLVTLWSGKGQGKLEQFGQEIVKFAGSLVAMAQVFAVSGTMDFAGSAKKAAEAGATLSELAKAMPEGQSLKTFLIGGNKDLSTFGTEIAVFAEGLLNLCKIMNSTQITQDSVDKAKMAGETLAALANLIPESGGLFTQEKNLASFGKQLQVFAFGINSFFTTVNPDIMPDGETLDKIINIATQLIDLGNHIGETAGSKNFITNFASGLGQLGKGLNDFFNSIFTVDPTMEEGMGTGMGMSLMDRLKSLFFGEDKVEELKEESRQIGLSVFDSFIMAFEDEEMREKHKEELNLLGHNTLEYLNKPEGDDETLRQKTELIGIDFLEGLLQGITNAGIIGTIYEHISSLGTGMVGLMRATLKERSPSRATMEIGEYFDEGLILGIKSLSGSVEDSAYNAGISMLNGISRSVELADSILEDNLNPVISPVLDLSNVRDNAGLISQLFGANSYLAASAIGSMGLFNQNGVSPVTIEMNNTFEISGVDSLDRSTAERFADMMIDRINDRLGKEF